MTSRLARLEVMPPLPIGVYARSAAQTLPFPLGEPTCRLYSRARHGLFQGVLALGLRAGDEVLAPAYHHGSEIEALLRAGLQPRFYEATETLAPDEDELERALRPQTRALYLVHALGFPQDAARWRAWCDERGLLLVEDAAQAWLATSADSRPVGVWGDLGIFCLYKTFGIPDGAALVCTAAPPGPSARGRRGLRPLLDRHRSWLRSRSAWPERLDGQRAPAPYDAALDFGLGDPSEPPARASRLVLPRVVDASAADRRRTNYALLLEELSDRVAGPFAKLTEGASPFAFPVQADDKERLLATLRAAAIDAVDLWRVPHPALPAERFPAAARLRASVAAVPVHQELRVHDLERIAEALRRRPRRQQPRVEIVDGFDEVAEEWGPLAARAGNVFATPEWLSEWWRSFGRDRRLIILACRTPGGDLVALLPLYLWSRRHPRVLRHVGHGPSDELGPICAPEDSLAVARALEAFLRSRSDWDVLLAEDVPRSSPLGGVLGARVLRRDENPVLRFRGSWEDFLRTRPSRFRHELRRRERRLRERYDVRLRLVRDTTTLDADLDTLFALHSARWGPSSSVFAPPHDGFHRRFAHVALQHGWLRLLLLELDGIPAAVSYGFRFRNVEVFYQVGRDPRRAHEAVGSVIFAHRIRLALEDGVEECRFGRGAQPQKLALANADRGVETLALAHGAFGRAALAGIRLSERPVLRRGVQRLVPLLAR